MALLPPSWHVVAIVLVACAGSVSAAYNVDVTTAPTCVNWMEDYTKADYALVMQMNCDKVAMAKAELLAASKRQKNSDKQEEDWDGRIYNGTLWCQQANQSFHDGDAKQAAIWAVKAYGTGVMQNSLCCTRLTTPHCTVPAATSSQYAVRTPAGALILVLVIISVLVLIANCIDSCIKRRNADERGVADEDEFLDIQLDGPDTPSAGSGTFPAPVPDNDLKVELQDAWIRHSCLRVMPGAHRMAASTASLFASLQATFEFQPDNVRNQYEHLLSMWRSHISSVADRSVAADLQVEEGFLLATALEELHCELLDGFYRWREKFQACEPAQMEKAAGVPKAGGIQWEHVAVALCPTRSDREAAELTKQLVEIAVYLCVWGEGGNVRFMPEVVYFISEMALTAEGPGGSNFYGPPPPRDGTFHSGRFLARVIRPIYTLVFDEWYQKVDINPKGGDAKVLHKGFERFLLPDVANYDDWNEFFCDPDEVVKGLLLASGSDLFDEPPGKRFAALRYVHWQASLKGSQIKTHRECHSFWGVLAATHRIWLLHSLLFYIGVSIATGDAALPPKGTSLMDRALLGETAIIRFAAVGLLVPFHALLMTLARAETTSNHLMRKAWGWLGWCPGGGCCVDIPACLGFCLKALFWCCLFTAPILTYGAVRYFDGEVNMFLDANEEQKAMGSMRTAAIAAHYFMSATGFFFLLLAPAYSIDKLFKLTPVPLRLRAIRYLFWIVVLSLKFLLAMKIFVSVWNATQLLEFINLGRETPNDILGLWRSSNWAANFYEWTLLWATAFFLFCADTAMWFQVGCMYLGVCIVFVQRGCKMFEFMFQDDISKIPQRFSDSVFRYAPKMRQTGVSEYFPPVWDRIIAYMRYEDKCESDLLGDLSYTKGGSRGYFFERLSFQTKPLKPVKTIDHNPVIFEDMTSVEVFFRNYCVMCKGELNNADMKWRLFALARGLGLPIPRPYRAPYIPGITVLIPHYGETIILAKQELFDLGSGNEKRRSHVRCNWFKLPVRETVPLIDWLRARYSDEYRAFTNRMTGRGDWPGENHWKDFNDEQWDKICVWASMRMQTLWRTVAGMMLYYPALEAHYAVQRMPNSSLGQEGIWNPRDCFTCIISMQVYTQFDKTKLMHTNKMFDKFPDSLKVAYIDSEDLFKQAPDAQHEEIRKRATMDRVHQRQQRRYYSCLIDKHCAVLPNLRRAPRYRVELPGFPILGDGKSDNQNHSIIFMRGIFCQCIDANQGAYFEQMLLLPCVLGEFRTHARGKGKAKRIIGLPEHITSDFGSIGDFAAGSEIAFGTISQRSFAVLGGRMHYGHPDIMNKQFMMQQGGVSKATKTINLSEDIFAGMDFTLRGQGRKIRHCEYFHLAKGRDLGFNAVLGFFSKLSNGTGEQLLTRQMLRLSHVLQLPESLTFYYAHAGYYITQYLVSVSMPIMVFTWLLVLCADCDRDFRAFSDISCNVSASEAMASMLSTWYSVYILFFLVVTSMPLFAEMWMERNFGSALVRWFKQLCTCSFLLFIFQAKIIGFYIMAEIRQGGASYVATGRGLPTDRREFVGAPAYIQFKLLVIMRGLDTDRLASSAALRSQLITAVQVAIAKACGGGKMTPDCVSVEPADSGRLVVKVNPPHNMATLAMKDKLTATNFATDIAQAIAVVPGISAVCSSTLQGSATLQESTTGWHIEKVGGLYLDYTQHTYYDGISLLFMTGLVLIAGGYSQAGAYQGQLWFTFLSLALVIFSWLYAPFIFNPYQFSVGYLADDVKAWWGLFFRSGGKHWAEWFERVVLKPKRGIGKSILDFELMFMFFTGTAWVAELYGRQVTMELIYSKDPLMKSATIVSLLPPFFLAIVYCVTQTIIEWLAGCRHRIGAKAVRTRGVADFFGYRRASRSSSDSDSESSSSSDGEGGTRRGGATPSSQGSARGDARHSMEDQQVVDKPEHRLCENGMPLAVSGLIIASLEVLEMMVPLMVTFIKKQDYKSFVAGIMVKAIFYNVILFLAESMLSMKGFCNRIDRWAPLFHKSLTLLVYGNRIARDIFVSAFIFVTLMPWVVINALNDLCLPRFSIHQALIYRTPGPLAKKQIRYDDDDTDVGSAYGGDSSDSSSTGSPSRTYGGARSTSSLGPPPGASATWFQRATGR